MRIEKYTPAHYPALEVAARTVHVDSLLCRPFVDYYYFGQPWSELYLAFDDDECIAFIGIDQLHFEHLGQELSVGMATNFYTLRPGIGGFLWLKWMKSCAAGLVFGGSNDTHKIVKGQKFTYYEGVNVYTLNAKYMVYKTDKGWRRLLKNVLRYATRRRLSKYRTQSFLSGSSAVSVRESTSEDASIIESAVFSFRFAPDAGYLRWRYNSSLGFVRYRWFEIYSSGERIGYCILNDAPEQVVVAHSDGTDPEKLAYGILEAVFKVDSKQSKKRTALLVSSHPVMQAVFARHGFTLDVKNRPMALGALRSKIELPKAQDWLINFGLGDNDLRPSNFYD